MFLNNSFTFRMQEDQLKQITAIVLMSNGKYESESHFVRCAVLKAMNNETRN